MLPSPRTFLPLLAAAALGGAAARAAEPYATVDPDAVERMLAAGDVRVYDANPRDVYDRHHLPGAVFVGHARDLAPALPADKATRLVFYCAGPK